MRIFLRYGTGFLVSSLLLIAVGNWLWMQVGKHDHGGEGADAQVHKAPWQVPVLGMHYFLATELAGVNAEERSGLAMQLQRRFNYPIEVRGLPSVLPQLQPGQAVALRAGAMVLPSGGSISYRRLPGTDQVVVLNDLSRLPPPAGAWYDSLVVDVIAVLLIVILAMALPLYFVLYRAWRDIHALGAAAATLSDGRPDRPLPPMRTHLMRPLHHALQRMSTQLRALLEGQRVLSDAVAHEIRTPLARMRFGIEMLRDANTEHEREQLLDGIIVDVLRLEQLAEAGIHYSRIGRMQQIECERVDVRALLLQLRDATTPPPPVTVSLGSIAFTALYANRAALQLALRNLLCNALRHASSTVRISAERSGSWLLLAVDDDGPGVELALREQVFQPYVQLQPNRDGFGLGLAIVRVIAEKHRGHADVIDSPLGGARFRLLLPA